MASLKTDDWNSSKEKNFKIRTKKKSNSFSDYSQFDDEFESEDFPQLNKYKKQDYRLSKRKDFRGNFDRA